MTDSELKIVYTLTDEAPALATHSLLPIIRTFVAPADLRIELQDISLAGRIIANFPEHLTGEQRRHDALAELGKLAQQPHANIIKLPNVSASIPQLTAAIKELQDHGYNIPDYPEEPKTDEERNIRCRYAKILGSAVNPVLREGNSDRRVAEAVKQFAKDHPHSMGEWRSDSKSHVASMSEGDFYSSEKSFVLPSATDVRIELTAEDGESTVLRHKLSLEAGEVIDAAVMRCSSLRDFLKREIDDALRNDVLLSIHLKATMMKVSDPIIFGHAVNVYFKDVFDKYASLFDTIGVDQNNGLGDMYARIERLPDDERKAIKADLSAVFATRPKLAMVDSDQGITNLHVPSDTIIDASMPAAIRASGKMWGPDGKLHDMKALIPDRSYAGVYQVVIESCKQHGAFDVTTMGNVSNVGLMAQKAEEYGSHDKTFEIPTAGIVRVIDTSGKVLLEHAVATGDIWRMCQTKDAAIRDWVRLAVKRARITNNMAIFWLDENRAHDANLIEKVKLYLLDHDTDGLDIQIMSPVEATRLTCQRCRSGSDTISVTGNVLRDYLTDLFPILELGTSAKMLSIIPLLAGGGLFETGAGGSGAKHVRQFLKENHLRWDSLGEFLALAVSLEELAIASGSQRIHVLADALCEANRQYLWQDKSPSRNVHELDNRGSHFYLALFWAQALATQNVDSELQAHFADLAKSLAGNEEKIMEELNSVQGQKVDLGGYYQPDSNKVNHAMRPSPTFNEALSTLSAVEN